MGGAMNSWWFEDRNHGGGESATTSRLPCSDLDAGAVAAAGQAIGLQLRAVYGDAVREPVPDRFLELLEKLDNA